ncbi:MAG: hypothetical protein BWY88_00480 [Synergistetes bacterium ADurb.Bin520]|nr:MAG: hypothetical protein BWY88_00480 [Synergistetes bacterium ADurb.Bin520]
MATGNADEAPRHGQDYGFRHELGDDVPALRPQGHADSDFPGALRDGDQHDVHDADPSHQETYGGYPAQEQGECARHPLQGVQQVQLVRHVEVRRVQVGKPVEPQDLLFDGALGLAHDSRRGGPDVDQRVLRVSRDVTLEGGDGDEHRRIGDRGSLGLHDPRHPVAQAVEPDLLPHRVPGAAEEFLVDLMADDHGGLAAVRLLFSEKGA